MVGLEAYCTKAVLCPVIMQEPGCVIFNSCGCRCLSYQRYLLPTALSPGYSQPSQAWDLQKTDVIISIHKDLEDKPVAIVWGVHEQSTGKGAKIRATLGYGWYLQVPVGLHNEP